MELCRVLDGARILLDEVLEYLISAGGVKVEKTTLRDETLLFLKRLPVAVANARNTALVFVHAADC